LCKLQVEKAFTFEELEMFVNLKLPQSNLLIQNYLIGSGYAANIAASGGKISHYFQYRRIHEPGFGGASSLRESLKPQKDVLHQCQAIINAFDYSGIGMIEFRMSNNELYLMEFNARFWGSLSLPIFCGMDFPKILYYQFAKQKTFTADDINVDYKLNLRARNILSDFKWHILRGFKSSIGFLTHLAIILPYRLISKKEVLDMERLSDFGPALATYKQSAEIIFEYFKIICIKIWFKFFKYVYMNLCRKKLENIQCIHFVCLGNINRSIFAERYLITKLDKYDKGLRRSYRVSSSGTKELVGRPCALIAIKNAKQFGVSLNGHSSKFIYRGNLNDNQNTLILTMDLAQYKSIKKQFPNSNVFPLGIFSKGDITIQDPYKGTAADYRNSFSTIQECINNFLLS